MLLVITIKADGRVDIDSGDEQKNALAFKLLRDRIREVVEQWVADGREGSGFEIMAEIAKRLDDRDRVALGAIGFSGVAVTTIFGGE